jgi:hypothetical protein
MKTRVIYSALFFLAPVAQGATGTFENPATLDAANLLGSNVLIGEHYRIDNAVHNDGRNNTYHFRSDILSLQVTTDSLAEERAHEIDSIVVLRKLKETDAYKKGMEAAADAPLTLTRHVIEDPVGTLEKLPDGLNNLLNDLGAAVTSIGRGDSSSKEDNAMVKDLIGFNTVKRRLAADIKVDPYSSNTTLQQELNDVAWAMFAGGAPIELAMVAVPAAVSVAVRAIDRLDGGQLDWKIPPATLRQAMDERVQAIGLNANESEKLVYHPHCSLRHQSIMVSAVVEMKDVPGRDEFLRQAITASDEIACRRYQQMVEMAWSFHRNIRPVTGLTLRDGLVWLDTAEHHRILIVPYDYMAWTRANAALVDDKQASKPTSLWLAGRVSERTARELQQRQITVYQQVEQQYPQYLKVAAVLLPERTAAAETEDEQNKTGKLVSDVGSGVGNLVSDVLTGFGLQEKQQGAGNTEATE